MHAIRRSITLVAATLAAAAALSVPAEGAPADLEPAPDPIEFWDEAATDLSVGGTYTPIVGDFGGAAANRDDIFWYAPGAGTDHIWLSDGDATFTKFPSPSQVGGTYTPLVGDFSGNGLDDIVWYAPGNAADYLWTNTGLGFTTSSVTVSGTYAPVVLDDAVGKDDILWAKAGGGPGWVWSFEGGGAHLSNPITSPAGSTPLVGLFSAGSCADVFWYVPGYGADALWYLNCAGQIGDSSAQTVNGIYQPVVDDFTPNGDGVDDILWHRHPGGSTLWQAEGDGTWDASAHAILSSGTPLPVAKNWGLVHFFQPNGQDLVWWKTGADDYMAPLLNTELGAGYVPIVGRFVGANADIFWYKPGNAAERLFFTA